MHYLVAGAARVDAGKTTFSVGLVDYLDAVGFKPRAGNDYWYDHDDYRRAIADGRLYGKDAKRLAAASAAAVAPEDVNPVHRLWRPAPTGDDFLGRPGRRFVLDRVGEGYVLNADADIPDSARESLPVADAPSVSTVEELNRQIQSRHLPHLRAIGERIAETETAVVESYGDIARPLQELDVSRVAVVEPARVRIYDGDRYSNACEVASGSPHEGQLEERVGDVLDLIDPESAIDLPPLADEERNDPGAIAEAYADAYEALV